MKFHVMPIRKNNSEGDTSAYSGMGEGECGRADGSDGNKYRVETY